MCGISALFAHQMFPLTLPIAAMTAAIRHRGPDDEGYILFQDSSFHLASGDDTPAAVLASSYAYSPKNHWKSFIDLPLCAALGHRRLSILDLSSRGHQPMCTSDQRFWITYNGEIYNFQEIRKELEQLGYFFQTQSDTEVILNAFQEWEMNAFERFNGMFAFVIYDRLKHEVIAVRDRFGVKPFYYWVSPQGFIAFASEIKQFTVLPGWIPIMNGQRIYDFLQFGILDHTSETCFSDVYQLRGGEYLYFSQREPFLKLRPQRWYTLTPKHFKGSFQEASLCFGELLKHAVELRMRSDVDVGTCLSGGLDSSSIVCLVNALLHQQNAADKQKTFSACSDVKRFDERPFIETVVKKTNVDARFTYPQVENLFENFSEITWHQDEPFGSTSIYAQWLVFKLVKESCVKVVLDGQGADEHLAGYHGFFGNRFYDLYSSLQWKTLFREMKIAKTMHPSLTPLPLLLNKLVPSRIKEPLRRLMQKSPSKADWLNLPLLKATSSAPPSFRKYKTVGDQSQQQLLHTSLPMLLHWEDRDSMAHSIESRTPFLDYRLVEFSLGLPSEFKIANGWTKRVLRESMKGVLPEDIRCRIDKIGFATAEEEWLCRQEPKRFQTAIQQAIQNSRGILSTSSKQIVDTMIQGKRAFSFLPWRMISFGHWMERFNVQ